MGLLMVLWLAFAGRVRAQECYGTAKCSKFGEWICSCSDGTGSCEEQGESCNDGGVCECKEGKRSFTVFCSISGRNACTFYCPEEFHYESGGCGIGFVRGRGRVQNSACYFAGAPECEGWCPEGTVCRVKKSEPWKCTCGKQAQGLTCPEGTYESCGWSFLVSLPG